MTRKLRIFTAFLLATGWLFAIPAHAETLQEYNARLSSAQQAVTAAQAAVDAAQYDYDNKLIPQSSSSGSGITAKVYNNTMSMNPNESNLCSTITLSQINHNWGGGSVLGCNGDNVTVHYFGTITVPNTGTYKFRNIADDGFYMTINGQVVINEWFDKGCSGNWGAPIDLTAGTSYSIDAWFYENGGGACSTLYVSEPSGNWQVAPSSWFGQSQVTVMIKDPSLLAILQQKQADLVKAQQDLAAIGPYVYPPINAPTNLTVNINGDNVILNWNAPSDGTMPERYAISWSTSSTNGWGIATGNVGDSNALNTSISIPISVVNTDGLDKSYIFTVRSDNDTLHMYSSLSNSVSLLIPDQARIAAEAAALAEQQRLAAEAAALAEQQRLAAIAAEKARLEAEAAAKLAAEQEAARLAAEAAAKAEADRLAAEEAARLAEEERLKAEAEAKAKAEEEARLEAERIAAEEAAAKAEAEAKAKAEEEARLEAERIAAEEAAAKAEADAKAKAEEEARKLAEQKAAEEERLKAEAEAKAAEEEALKKAAQEGKLTEEQKEVVVSALIASVPVGQAISSEAIKEAGIEYKDLPPTTPVDVRTDESGNPVVITAEVAAQVELLQDPGALLAEALTDPGAALAALGSIGADMSPAEREEATKMVVATVVATGAAMNAVGAAASAATSTGGSTGGNSGGSGGGGGASSESKGVRRRKP